MLHFERVTQRDAERCISKPKKILLKKTIGNPLRAGKNRSTNVQKTGAHLLGDLFVIGYRFSGLRHPQNEDHT